MAGKDWDVVSLLLMARVNHAHRSSTNPTSIHMLVVPTQSNWDAQSRWRVWGG